MSTIPRILYLNMLPGSHSHERKLAGVRRYCSMRGWKAVPVPRDAVTPDTLPGILRHHRPAGCVVDGVACRSFLRPQFFRGIPVSYIAYPWAIAGKFPNFHFNSAEICDRAVPPISSLQLDFEREGFIAAKALFEGHSRSATDNRDRLGPLMVVRRKSTSGHGRHAPWILEAVDIIRREACDGLDAAALIARFPQSRRNFERRFREATGHGVLDEILHVRLEKACILLSRTDVPIGAISDFCGFRSYWALDDLFRSRFKMGMREWRRMNSRP